MSKKVSVRLDPVPSISAGPRSISCTDCDWESVYIIPEELDLMITAIIQHIQQHGIEIPTFEYTIY